jgi:hypothetical protein
MASSIYFSLEFLDRLNHFYSCTDSILIYDELSKKAKRINSQKNEKKKPHKKTNAPDLCWLANLLFQICKTIPIQIGDTMRFTTCQVGSEISRFGNSTRLHRPITTPIMLKTIPYHQLFTAGGTRCPILSNKIAAATWDRNSRIKLMSQYSRHIYNEKELDNYKARFRTYRLTHQPKQMNLIKS